MIFPAKFATFCPLCKKPIQVGDPIWWRHVGRAIHAECKNTPKWKGFDSTKEAPPPRIPCVVCGKPALYYAYGSYACKTHRADIVKRGWVARASIDQHSATIEERLKAVDREVKKRYGKRGGHSIITGLGTVRDAH